MPRDRTFWQTVKLLATLFPDAPPGSYVCEEGWLIVGDQAWTPEEWNSAIGADERKKYASSAGCANSPAPRIAASASGASSSSGKDREAA